MVTLPPFPPQLEEKLQVVLKEAMITQEEQGARAEGILGLAAIQARLGEHEAALRSYQTAFERYPQNIGVYLNYAEALRALGQEEKAEGILAQGVKQISESSLLHHAYGLSLIRAKKTQLALGQLKLALSLASDTERPQFGYVYAVALHDTGATARAVAQLRALIREYPNHPSLKSALDSYLAAPQ